LLWLYAIRKRARADGVSSLMTGDLGNLFFSADGPHWIAEHLRAGRVARALREARAWRSSSGTGWYAMLRYNVAPALLPSALLRAGRKLRGASTNEEAWSTSSAVRADVVSAFRLPARLAHLDERRRDDGRGILFSYLAEVAGQADNSMALAVLTGVDSRDPTADRRVIEVAIRQPEGVRRRDGIDRAVARGAMADRLPAAIVTRRRRGSQLPDWLDVMTAARREVAGELDMLEEHATSRELIDTRRLRSLVGEWPDRTASADPDVIRAYRLALLRSLVLSRYLRWFEGRAAETARPQSRVRG
jgi:asparagine synthase (glutamine-hydrolysing)